MGAIHVIRTGRAKFQQELRNRVLGNAKRSQVVAALVEGNSSRKENFMRWIRRLFVWMSETQDPRRRSLTAEERRKIWDDRAAKPRIPKAKKSAKP